MTQGQTVNDNNDKNVTTRTNLHCPFTPPPWRDIDIGCGLGILVLDFQYLCIIMTRIDLRPEMVDRDFKRIFTVVFDRGEKDYIWIWGRPWGGGGGTSMMTTPSKVLISVPDVL